MSLGASFQCPAFSLTGALRGVYRNFPWISIPGFVPRFPAVPGLVVAVPHPFVAVPGLFVAVLGLFVAVPGLLLAASRFCNFLNTMFGNGIYEQPTAAVSK